MAEAPKPRSVKRLDGTADGRYILGAPREQDNIVYDLDYDARRVIMQGLWEALHDERITTYFGASDLDLLLDYHAHHLLYKIIRLKHLKWGDPSRMNLALRDTKKKPDLKLLQLGTDVWTPPVLEGLNLPMAMYHRRRALEDKLVEHGFFIPSRLIHEIVLRELHIHSKAPITEVDIEQAVDGVLKQGRHPVFGIEYTARRLAGLIGYYGLGRKATVDGVSGWRLIPYRIQELVWSFEAEQDWTTKDQDWLHDRHFSPKQAKALRKDTTITDPAPPAPDEPEFRDWYAKERRRRMVNWWRSVTRSQAHQDMHAKWLARHPDTYEPVTPKLTADMMEHFSPRNRKRTKYAIDIE